MPRLGHAFVVLALSIFLPAQNPTTGNTTGAASDASATNAGRDLLVKSLRFMQGLPAFTAKATATMILPKEVDEEDDEPPTVAVEQCLAMPSRFALRVGDPFFSTAISDGDRLLRADSHFALHAIGAAPRSVVEFLTKPDNLQMPGTWTLVLLLAPSGKPGALVDAKQVELLADDKVGEHECHHVAIRDAGVQCEVWIQKGEEPFVRRHRPALATKTKSGDGANKVPVAPRIAYDVRFVEVGKALPEDAFAMLAPNGTTQVDDLDVAIKAKIAEKMARSKQGAAHSSIGKAAPGVELHMMDGSTKKLADWHGQVVVLDFWATWCQPCVQGLPKIAEITSARKNQGVVFVAVNRGESREKVEQFLAKKGLKIEVALGDEDLAAKFGVDGIPHTLVIGRDGIVHSVHIGFGQGAEVQIEADVVKALQTEAAKKGDAK